MDYHEGAHCSPVEQVLEELDENVAESVEECHDSCLCVCSASLEAVSPSPRNHVLITSLLRLYLHVQFTHDHGVSLTKYNQLTLAALQLATDLVTL